MSSARVAADVSGLLIMELAHLLLLSRASFTPLRLTLRSVRPLTAQMLQAIRSLWPETSARKEVDYMIDKVENIDIVIDGVKEISLEDIVSTPKNVQRILIVRTKHKENFYLKLVAKYIPQLDFKRVYEPDPDDSDPYKD